jgi:hypothetical protein
MPAPLGNQNNKKWKTQGERQHAFKLLCEHIKAGYSRDSFPPADWDTVERYCAEFPVDFPADLLEEAFRSNRMEWERIGLQGAKGEIEGFNNPSWVFNMKNRFKAEWSDKTVVDSSVTHTLTDFK